MEKITNVKALEYVLENADLPAEYAEKISKIKESFEKKSGSNRKPTIRQEENKAVKVEIAKVLEGSEGMTASEILANGDFEDGMTNQRISALLRQMVNDDKTVDKFVEKKKSYFKLVA